MRGKSIFYDLFCLVLTMRSQTAISACVLLTFSVVIRIESVNDANDIPAPGLLLSPFSFLLGALYCIALYGLLWRPNPRAPIFQHASDNEVHRGVICIATNQGTLVVFK